MVGSQRSAIPAESNDVPPSTPPDTSADDEADDEPHPSGRDTTLVFEGTKVASRKGVLELCPL
ncbi:hypothetical protein PtA15_7A28 [Puccinia triticina]|uniref:Uncharacterized protein n=1 Tax=Puccinia triticina TaxID=208348 RepID=A0ABY7CP98_9BASI|nr:uncharacterized protein PtA15_7A28 [Puccinia triticina]WAQ86302.1 hypothetical protein PtA15_7A28 [Puccinia triticina]